MFEEEAQKKKKIASNVFNQCSCALVHHFTLPMNHKCSLYVYQFNLRLWQFHLYKVVPPSLLLPGLWGHSTYFANILGDQRPYKVSVQPNGWLLGWVGMGGSSGRSSRTDWQPSGPSRLDSGVWYKEETAETSGTPCHKLSSWPRLATLNLFHWEKEGLNLFNYVYPYQEKPCIPCCSFRGAYNQES